ncbi:exodeoxyribonuclease V subunit alpha [Pasteurellaceae bacterium Macca]|nr:exodeoxyribonuclease V subunit alpha [Pasteurellaceae bacterium Macca]
MLALLAQLKNAQIISELNYQFAKLIGQKQDADLPLEQQNLAIFLGALLSFHVMQGNSCLVLESHAAKFPFGLQYKELEKDFNAEISQKIGHLSPLQWQEHLKNHPAFSHQPENPAPMLFQHGRLYFYRYWQAEAQIAQDLHKRSLKVDTTIPLNQQALAQVFPAKSGKETEIDWQQIAVATALTKPFTLISGGPGTGKTTTVVKLLTALQLRQLYQERPLLKIALVAPTGKAAARLKESIAQNLQQLDLPDMLKESVASHASTIHALIGIRPSSDKPIHHAQNPLHLDLLVVDEASMVDLFLLEKLLNALKPSARLIMLGDKDQLASVEAGNAMGELGELLQQGYSPAHCHTLRTLTEAEIYPKLDEAPTICDSLCHLRKSYRFDENSGIGHLAREINAKRGSESWQLLANSPYADLTLHAYPAPQAFNEKRAWQAQCVAMVVEKAVEAYRTYLQQVKARIATPTAVSVSDIFARFQQVRFLSALRVGELGVEHLNQRIAEALQKAHLVSFKQSRESYLGKAILITENAPQLSIFSGDIGLVLPDETGKSRVYFDTQINGEHQSISISRLPRYEPAYVMTVHKSQGSEFAHTLLIMPLTYAPVLSKELLYTAVTRAKAKFTLFGSEKIWKQAVKTEIQRQSGLKVQLLALK